MSRSARDATIRLRGIHSFHVGGRSVHLADQPRHTVRVSGTEGSRVVDLNGDYVVGQLYAQHFQLAEPRTTRPLLLWHGGAMTGATWETTPDGRPGWLELFLHDGFDVVVSDAVERGRASWAPFPAIYETAPLFRTKQDAWGLFRIGHPDGYAADPAHRTPFAGQRFPAQAFDALCAQFVPRWTGNDALSLDAYEALLRRLGSSIVVAHSQGGWFGLNAALRCPEHVRALVVIEPAGAPTLSAGDAARLAAVPMLVIWGDYCRGHAAWVGYRAQVDAFAAAGRGAGARIDVLDLPAAGIRGNSHLPMMDDNSAEIARMLIEWIDTSGALREGA